MTDHRDRPTSDTPDYWRLAVVEDHLLQRLRTQEILDAQTGLRVVWSGESLPELMNWVRTTDRLSRPHLVVLDLHVDRGVSADPATVAALVNSGIRVLVLSALTSVPLVRSVLRAGVSGIVGKRDSEQDILDAIWTVLNKGHWMTPELAAAIAGDPNRPQLSPQEERTLVLYASGLTLDAVAAALNVKRDTAKQYLERVKAKYAAADRPVRTKVEISQVARADGYLDGL